MGKFQSRKKKLIAYAIIVSLSMQSALPCVMNAAMAAPKAAPPVINIAKPNESGLSHNKAGSFNVGKEGIVFNNNASAGNVNSVLAGQVGTNTNLAGNAAKTILQEVTGSGISNLNGMMEIAGSKANLIIANPNGIVGNGFGFINVDRATLVTGKPNITADGKLDSFTVNSGYVNIEGTGNTPVFDEAAGQYKYAPVSKLDIYTNAANINAELWAQDELNIVAGKNKIDYATGKPTADFGSQGSGVNLDVGALGGMYAGKITLVGTNKGLGMNVAGNISAGKNLSITNEGKIVFTKSGDVVKDEQGNITDSTETTINSDGTINIDSGSGNIENSANISAKGSISLDTEAAFINSGKVIAGEAYEKVEGSEEFIRDDANMTINAGSMDNRKGGILDASNILQATVADTATLAGSISAVNNVDIKAGGIVDVNGSVFSEKGNIILAGEKVKYNELNLQAKDKDSIKITETDPDVPPEPPEPEPPRQAEDLTVPDIADTSDAAETIKQGKVDDSELALVADETVDGIYRPIIDHAANGVDLVQIAQANSNGVSRNVYTDFNIKSSGLILNNATKYAKTELGGYIDRNMFLAGNGARVILNEVSSSRASTLNGYLEVAGNKASVVIANANGISVNGLGFINTDNVILSTGKVTNWADGNMKFSQQKGNINIAGDGLNGRNPVQLDLVADNITVDRSELWGNNLRLSADGLLDNTGKIAATKDMEIAAENMENTQNGFIEAGENLQLDVAEKLHLDTATLKADKNMQLKAGKITNESNSLISSGQDMTVTADSDILNNKSVILAGKKLDVTAQDITNEETALINAQDAVLNASTITNSNANIYVQNNMSINVGSMTNKNMGHIHAGGDTEITAKGFTNTKASFDILGSLKADIDSFTNEDSGYLGVGKDAQLATGSFTNQSLGNIYVSGNFTDVSTGDFLNEDGLIAIGKTGSITAENVYNQNDTAYKQGSLISSAGDLYITARKTAHNRSSDIESQGNITINAADLINDKEKFVTDWDVTYEDISYKIPHLNAPNYYDAMREFLRTIHTGVIKEETNDANIIASGNITINTTGDVLNHYSKIAAGKDLTVEAGGKVENIGYQGTIHHDDLGQDNHYWKYKKHKRWHIGCHYVYGTTVIPYEDHNVYDQEQSDASERLSVMSGVGTVKIISKSGSVINKTLEADGNQYEDRQKTVSTQVDDALGGNTAGEHKPFLDISQLQYNSRIYQMNKDPNAKYLIETNSKYADYHEFLSSDYLLERVKADPEKVSKRLGDGYFEQQFVLEQIHNLTGKKYLSDYGSDLEQFKALMEAGAVAAEAMSLEIGVALTKEQIASLTSDIVWLVEEEINGQKVLVPEVYLAAVRAEDLTADGALIIGGEVEIYAKENIENIGTIKADGNVEMRGENIFNRGGSIAGENVDIEAQNKVVNKSGSIRARIDAILKGESIINETNIKETEFNGLSQSKAGNTATISAGNDLTLDAESNIVNRGAHLTADGDVTLNAGKNIEITTVANEKHVAVANQGSAEIHSVQHQQSVIAGDNINMNAGNELNLSGAITSAEKDTVLTAGKDVNINAVKDLYSEESTVGSKGGSYYNHNRQVDETVKGTNIAGQENITVTSGSNINIKGSNITSEAGKASLTAKENVNIENENEYHERLHELHEESHGFLSSKTTDIYDYSNVDAVIGSNISAGSIDITSGKDTNVKASSVVADNDVNIKAGGSINTEAAKETSESEYMKQVKKSGLLSGGGFGFTIGKEKQKDQYANQNTENIGSTIGSLEGSINMEANKDVAVKGSDIIAGKDINITGQNVDIENTENIYNAQEHHEYKRSGLTISVGGAAFEAVQDVIAPIERANQVEDKRLSALYGIKAGQEAMDIYDNLHAVDKAQKAYDFTKDMSGGDIIESIKAENAADLAKAKNEEYTNPNNWNIGIGFGTQHSESNSDSTTIVSQGSNIKAEGDVTITATEKDLNIKGSNVAGENVDLNAKGDINITSSETTNTTEQNSSSSSASVGVTVGAGGLLGVNASYSKGEQEVAANSTVHNESTVTAEKDLTFTSGEDTNIKGGKLSGDKVTGEVGGNLNIESKQDSNDYKEESKSGGIGIDYDFGTGKVGVTGGISKGDIDSEYDSVTDQSGIYAGKEGFDINVGENTDLKGGIISSEAEAEKNKISTGTLTYEDIHNKAEYEAGSTGVSIDTSKDAEFNEKGVTPNIGMSAEDKAESDTKSTIAEGEIEIRNKDKQKQDLKDLNRDTRNSLNKLGEIFDKESIQERQELAGLFGELAYNQIHDMKGTDEQKAAYHALVGGIMSQLTSGDFLAGASAAAVNKLVMSEIKKIAGKDPAMMQWLSAAVGAVVGEITSGNIQVGAGAAVSGTKYNDLREELYAQYGIDPSKIQINEVDQPQEVLNEGNLSLSGAILTAVTGEGIKQLTGQMNDTVKIDTSHISPSMNIAYDTGLPSYNKVLLNGVSKVADNAINIGTATYSVYMDATKYSGVSLGAAITLDLSTLYFVNKGEEWMISTTNAPVVLVKLVSGGTAYLIDEKLTTPIKESIDERFPYTSVIEHRINDLNNGGIE